MLGRMLIALALTSLTAACATMPANDTAVCSASRDARGDLAGALIADGGDQSKRAGLALLDKLAAGCALRSAP